MIKRVSSAVIGVVAAVLAFCGLLVGQHLWADHLDHHLVVEVLKYNIGQGKLLPLPTPSGSTAPAQPAK